MPPLKQEEINPAHFLRNLIESADLGLNDVSVLRLTRVNLKILAKHIDLGIAEADLKVKIQTVVILELNERGLISERVVQTIEMNPGVSLTEKSLLRDTVRDEGRIRIQETRTSNAGEIGAVKNST